MKSELTQNRKSVAPSPFQQTVIFNQAQHHNYGPPNEVNQHSTQSSSDGLLKPMMSLTTATTCSTNSNHAQDSAVAYQGQSDPILIQNYQRLQNTISVIDRQENTQRKSQLLDKKQGQYLNNEEGNLFEYNCKVSQTLDNRRPSSAASLLTQTQQISSGRDQSNSKAIMVKQ